MANDMLASLKEDQLLWMGWVGGLDWDEMITRQWDGICYYKQWKWNNVKMFE